MDCQKSERFWYLASSLNATPARASRSTREPSSRRTQHEPSRTTMTIGPGAQAMGSPLAPGSGRFAHLVHALRFEGLHDLRIVREKSTLYRARKAQPCP